MTESSTILKGVVASNRASNKVKFIVGGLVIVALIAYLIISSISNAGAYYREVGEVVAQSNQLAGKNLRVSGNVVTESVKYDAPTLDLSFKISDTKDTTQQIAVHFHGVQPDQITREGASAIIEGALGSNGVIQANNLLLKCPSRYEEGVKKDAEQIQVQAIK